MARQPTRTAAPPGAGPDLALRRRPCSAVEAPADDIVLGTGTQLLAVLPDAVIAVDSDGRILFGNSRAEALFGYPADTLAGRVVDSLFRGGRERPTGACSPSMPGPRRSARRAQVSNWWRSGPTEPRSRWTPASARCCRASGRWCSPPFGS